MLALATAKSGNSRFAGGLRRAANATCARLTLTGYCTRCKVHLWGRLGSLRVRPSRYDLHARPGNGKGRQLSVRWGLASRGLRHLRAPYAHRVLHSLHPPQAALISYPHRNHRTLRLRGSVSLCSLRVRPARLTPLGLTSYSQSTAFAASGTAGAHSVLHWTRPL